MRLNLLNMSGTMSAARPGFTNLANAGQGLTQSPSRSRLPRAHGARAGSAQVRPWDVSRMNAPA
jgi:hypothetical protein